MPALRNPRHEKAAQQYVFNGRNKSKAYRSAFSCDRMKPETINNNAYKLFKRQDVKQRVRQLEHEFARIADEEFGVDARYVLKRLVEIDQMDVLDILQNDGSLKPIADWPEVWRRSLTGFDLSKTWTCHSGEREILGIVKKIKWPNKIKNLELIGKHFEVQAFSERAAISSVTEETIFDENVDPQEAINIYRQLIK